MKSVQAFCNIGIEVEQTYTHTPLWLVFRRQDSKDNTFSFQIETYYNIESVKRDPFLPMATEIFIAWLKGSHIKYERSNNISQHFYTGPYAAHEINWCNKMNILWLLGLETINKTSECWKFLLARSFDENSRHEMKRIQSLCRSRSICSRLYCSQQVASFLTW